MLTSCATQRGRGRAWRHVRGVLLLVALLGAGASLPPKVAEVANRKAWRLAHNQEQFARWSKALEGLGVHKSAKELEKATWRGVQSYRKTWGPVQRGLGPIVSQLGVAQNWAMFSNPQTHPFRVHVEVDRGHGLQTVYVSRSDEYTWRRAEFDHNRMRKLVGRLGRSGDPGLYDDFTRWVATRVRQDFEDAVQVQIRRHRWTTQLGRGADYDASGAFEDIRILDLGSVR